ncbi:MAG TPA: glutathione S-transferase [Acetobacteraceae bacterium]|jgi:glutathione S-transferase|nr:MAG: glutathione S-transferase [Acidocella sp. 20-58-15]HQT66066.1 glutathione S-transferase [Acetobacteraceae bacterium]HQU01461.1 glutathione S-transferase [Acetobacteraceae bacterium]
MKLYYSAASPYVRKVMACAIARDIEGFITKIPTNPHLSPANLINDNPLSKVPCLVTDDGFALFDSPVICEYLDCVDNALPMFPAALPARWVALKYQAIGDGIMDAAVGRRMEQAKPAEDARTAGMERLKAAIDRALASLELDPPGRALDIGSITIGCALGYLDFRFAHEPWREAHPRLAAWFKTIETERAFAETMPA